MVKVYRAVKAQKTKGGSNPPPEMVQDRGHAVTDTIAGVATGHYTTNKTRSHHAIRAEMSWFGWFFINRQRID